MRQQYSLILASTLKTITHNRVEPPPTKCPTTDGLGTARSTLSLRNTAPPAHIGTYGLVTWPLVMQANGAVLVFQGVRRE
ncbi:MAG: hypothetical protein MUQ27_05175 [Acidimicrobiia bacterium]|nr:hypothetical protein [Acidimicrobiia bacterium]